MKKWLQMFPGVIAFALVCTMAIQPAALAWDDNHNHSSKTSTPDDFHKLLFFLSSTPFTSVDGSFLVGGLFGGNGLHFQSHVMNRSDGEIAQNRADAIVFFNTRFGVDVTDPKVYFTGFETLSETHYRAVVVSDQHVPSTGWPVHDGGWIVVVTDPAGITLGGEFPGMHVPGKTMFVFGNYKIDRPKSPMILSFKSVKPITPESDRSFMVSCEIHSDEFGVGQAIGATLPIDLPNGQLVYNTRNIITFPPFGEEVKSKLPN